MNENLYSKALNNFPTWINTLPLESLKTLHRHLWEEFHTCSLKEWHSRREARETFWKIRHVQYRLRELRYDR